MFVAQLISCVSDVQMPSSAPPAVERPAVQQSAEPGTSEVVEGIRDLYCVVACQFFLVHRPILCCSLSVPLGS